ncbi:hypothetical protein CALVIDRAFT_566649 [Calocera viscosa TUFC12733]|uniref:Uncharacterized protein n=1 Tax=Calocera viscosa (strain TUFC12733) TaxID=1330018 RepID=A0A167JB83_CALVF|nr:hypothetical protein CALVIDRAFT_566649 [Calocera viscosa TUFC12733]
MANIDLFLFLLRLICSSLLVLLTLSLTLLQPTGNSAFESHAPGESDALLAPLRTRVPRHRVIIFCSIALAACWIADAAVISGRGIVEKVWEPAEELWRGEEVAVILNFLVWTGVVGIGAWKESYRKEVWSSMTLKVITLLAGTMEVTTFVLLCLGLRVFQNPIHRPEFRILGPILHLFISLLRMLVLLPLLSVLFWSTRYLHVQPAAERTSLLASEATSGPNDTHTLPVPSQDGNGMTNASQDRPKVDEKKPSPSGWEMCK